MRTPVTIENRKLVNIRRAVPGKWIMTGNRGPQFEGLPHLMKLRLTEFINLLDADPTIRGSGKRSLILSAKQFSIYVRDAGFVNFLDLTEQHATGWFQLQSTRGLTETIAATRLAPFIRFLRAELLIDDLICEIFLLNEKLPRKRNTRTRNHLPADEKTVEQILDTLAHSLNNYQNWKSYLILKFLWLTPFNLHEILQLRLRQFNFETNELVISGIVMSIPAQLMEEIREFLPMRELESLDYSDYLIRGRGGLETGVCSVNKHIYRQWSFFGSCWITAPHVKNLQQKVIFHQTKMNGSNH